jgi:hypothetical protein
MDNRNLLSILYATFPCLRTHEPLKRCTVGSIRPKSRAVQGGINNVKVIVDSHGKVERFHALSVTDVTPQPENISDVMGDSLRFFRLLITKVL